jgi:putative ABC transport system permease protein
MCGLTLLDAYVDRADAVLRVNAVYLQHGGQVAVYRAGGLDQATARPAQYSLTATEQAAVRQAAAADARIARVAGNLRGMGLVGNGCRSVPFSALGIDPETHRWVSTDPDVAACAGDLAAPVRGRPLFDHPEVEGRVALAAGLAALLGKTRVWDDLPEPRAPAQPPDCASPDAAAAFAADANVQLAAMAFDGSLAAVDADVVTIIHTPSAASENQVLQAPLPLLQRLYNTDAVTYMAVYVHRWSDVAAVAAQLRQRLETAGVPVTVYEFSDAQVNPYYAGSMTFLRSMAGVIVTIVASVVVLGVMNATTLTVYERTRELGTLRAVGYSRGQVSGLVVREVALLAALGVGAGYGLAHLAAALVRLAQVRVAPPGVPGTVPVVLTPGVSGPLLLAALLAALSLLVAWIVVRRRLRQRTAELLIAVNA